MFIGRPFFFLLPLTAVALLLALVKPYTPLFSNIDHVEISRGVNELADSILAESPSPETAKNQVLFPIAAPVMPQAFDHVLC